MAWTKRYMIPFQSRLEKQYAVYILDNADVYSEVKVLTGSAEPFTTQEDAKDNIFTPIRTQTGYLRIIDEEDGNLMEEIMPMNNTEKMVLLIERNLVNGEYQDGAIAWKGFLCAEVFTQPWNNNTKEIEFPVKSVLAALEDVQVNGALSGSVLRLSRTIASGISTLCTDMPLDNVIYIGSNTSPQWMLYKLNHTIFFYEETYRSGGDVITTNEGYSYSKAIGEIMKTLGLSLRMNGNDLYIARYDSGSYDLYSISMTWNEFYNISTMESAPSLPQGTMMQSADMMNALSFRGKRNEATFIPGGRIARVIFNIETSPVTISGLQLPETTEDGRAVEVAQVQVKTEGWNEVYVQAHDIRSGLETFVFSRFTHSYNGTQGIWTYTRNGNSDRESCLNDSPMRNSIFNDVGEYNFETASGGGGGRRRSSNNSESASAVYNNYIINTGAIPVRWYYKEYGSLNPINLESGLFLMQKVLRGSDSIDWQNEECYVISTSAQQTIPVNTYFCIKFTCHIFCGFDKKNQNGTGIADWGTKPSFDKFNIFEWDRRANYAVNTILDVEYQMACYLHVGGKWWNGTSWQDGGTFFYINLKNEDIISNKNAIGANVDESEGWFIPVSSEMTGVVSFGMMSFCHTDFIYNSEHTETYGSLYTYTVRPYAKIIEGLSVGVAQTSEAAESNRDKNIYRKIIMQSGFSEDKEIDLTIGTDNNNRNNTSAFILNSNGTENISTMPYMKEGLTQNERPEEHLLNRMATYYNQVRRTFKAIAESGVDIFNKKYTYLGRQFFGIDKKHNWRDDEQEIKFIEVS